MMNDKQKARWEEVREAYAEWLYKKAPGWRGGYQYIDFKKAPEVVQEEYKREASKILNLKDSSGNYLVEIPDPDPDQTVDNSIGGYLPPTGQGSEEACDCEEACAWWKWAQENMRCDNWIKCIPFRREG